jgi:riboflavin transporter FmnP
VLTLNGKGTPRTRTIEVTGAAIFGAASAVVAFILAPWLPRVPGWGIAFIDPVSILWVACYIVFGMRSGLIAAVIGTIGLLPVDPFTPWGPLMKFAATAPMIILPTLFLKFSRRGAKSDRQRLSLQLTSPSTYTVSMVLAVLVRDLVMILFNAALFLTIFAPVFSSISLGGITGWTAIIIIVAAINTEQSVWDASIPWLALRPTKVLENYGTW